MDTQLIDDEELVKIPKRELVKQLVTRDGNHCFMPECHVEFNDNVKPTIDHWIPLSRGGSWDLDNLKLMCKPCNSRKGSRMPDENGELPPLPRDQVAKAPAKSDRPEVCSTCNNGRLLGPDDECGVCGSGPMPHNFPHWAKVRPHECSHSGIFWCWCCSIGIIERVPAILDVLDAEGSLDG